MPKAKNGLKVCSTCQGEYDLGAFHKNRSRPDGAHSDCKTCVKQMNADWRTRNPNKKREQRARYAADGRSRRVELNRLYGITLEDYDEMFAAQGGMCAICNQPSIKNLSVDHEHATGAIRGLLCGPCNFGLGHFRDNTDFLAAAIEYLRVTKA